MSVRNLDKLFEPRSIAVIGSIARADALGAVVTRNLRRAGFAGEVIADVDFGDVLDYLAVDPHTRAILLYVERITHGRKFMSAERLASRVKPVVVLKAGRSEVGTRAAVTRIDPVAGADAVFDAAFRRAGMLRVATMAELFDAAETLALTREQAGDRVAILTNSGSVGILAADTFVAAGGQIAELSQETLQKLNRRLPATWSHGNPINIADESPAAGMAMLLRR